MTVLLLAPPPAGISIGVHVTGGTYGSILYIDSGGNLAQDNANLFYDDVNKRVGIGTSSPQNKLHLRDPGNTTPPCLIFESTNVSLSVPFDTMDIRYPFGGSVAKIRYQTFTAGSDLASFRFENGGGNNAFRFDVSNYRFHINDITNTASISVVIPSSSQVGLSLKTASSPSVNLIEMLDSSANVQLAVDKDWAIATTPTSTTQQIVLKSRTGMGGVGGDFTTELKRDGTSNYFNGTLLKFTDYNTSAFIKWISRTFTQGVNDLEFWAGYGASIAMVMSMPASGGIYVYNPVVNTFDASCMKVPAQNIYLASGTASPQGIFVFDAVTLTATSPISLSDAASLLINGAPIQGSNMTLTNRYGALIRANGAADILLALRGTTSQSGNILEVQNVSSTILSAFDSAGKFGVFAGFAEGVNILFGTTTGTKIGTSTSQKLAFYNSTPIVQPSGSVVTALSNLGLVNSPTITLSSDVTGTLPVGNGGTGVTSVTANMLVKGNGSSPLVTTGITVDSSDELYGYKAKLNVQTGTTYTLQASDTGKVVTLSNAGAITLTLPNSLLTGFCCTIVQKGAGQVTLSAAGGATLRNRSSFTKLAGQYAVGTLYVDSNSGGSAADYYFAGDGA